MEHGEPSRMEPIKLKAGRLNMVCVDGSEHSEKAFEWYCNEYHRDGDKVFVVHIHTMPNLPGVYQTQNQHYQFLQEASRMCRIEYRQ